MTNEKPIQCKSKGCYNPVLDGKYCVHCEKERKEKRNEICARGFTILGGGVVIKKVLIKKFPKFAAKAIKIISRI